MYLPQTESDVNYVRHINLDQTSILDYDIKFNNFYNFIFAIEWSLYTYLSQSITFLTKVYRIKLGDLIITLPIILLIATLSLYFLYMFNIKYTGVLSQVCLFITILTTLKKINILPFDKAVYYHKIFSMLTLFISLIHGIVSIYITKNNKINSKIATGYVFYMLLLINNLISISRFKDKFYNVFVSIHKILFILIFIIAMFHSNGYILYVFILYLLDMFYRIYLINKIKNLQLHVEYSVISKNLIKLEIVDKTIISKSGQYIYICIPQISLLEWHPFSITSSPYENKTLYIKVVGDWTRKLKNKILDGDNLDILIDGFYGNIAKYLLEYQYILIFGGGLGITPILSIIKYICYNYKNNLRHIKKVYFICTFEEYANILALLDPLYFEYKEVLNKENVYLDTTLFNTFVHISKDKYNRNTHMIETCKSKYNIHEDRPDIRRYLTDFNLLAFRNQVKKIGVFASGPENMINDVFEYSVSVSKNSKIRYDIYTENYKY